MPYKVVKTGSKFAVHKLDEEGNPTGKALGTHPDKAAADKQMKALYANEKKAKELPTTITATITDSEGNTSTVSKEIEVTEELDTKDYYGDEVDYYGYTGAISFAELEAEEEAQEAAIEVYNLTDNFTRLARCIMRRVDIYDKETALSNLANEFIARVNKEVTEQALEKSIKDKTVETMLQIAGDNQPAKPDPAPEPTPDNKELFIWKEGSTYRWLAAYSNNRQDDEREIISSESHKEFDKALDERKWPMPEVYLWHIPYPVGKADYHAYDESTGFPVAAGHFYKEMDWAAEGIIKAGWTGVSHGMPDRWVKLDPNNESVIVQHRTKEITFLPHWAAANKLSFSIISKEQSMSEIEKGLPAHKRPEFVKAFGEERVKQIEAALADKSKEADEAGIDKKEVDTTPEAKPVTQDDFFVGLQAVMSEVKELHTSLDNRLQALEKSLVKEADQFDIIEQLKAKSIIGKAAARVNGNSALAKDAPAEAEPEAGPTPVGLLNNLFAANEAWANKGGRR